MSIIDEITNIVRTASLASVDLEYVSSFDPAKAYDAIDNQPVYRAMIDALVRVLEHAAAAGLPKDRAVASVLGAHEDVIRYVIKKALRDRLLELGVEKIDQINVSLALEEINAKISQARIELASLVQGKQLHQFRSYMLYASDRWAKTDEEKAVMQKIAQRVYMEAIRPELHDKVS